MSGETFKPSKFTILVKLILIISAINIAALATMTIIATYSFKKDNKGQILDSNLRLARLMSSKTQSEFKTKIFQARQLCGMLKDTDDEEAEQDFFFKNNGDFIFLAVLRLEDGRPDISNSYYNEYFLVGNRVEKKSLGESAGRVRAEISKASNGISTVFNASPHLGFPAIGVAIPYREGIAGRVILTYLAPAEFLKTFQTTGAEKSFLVNGEGQLIAHPDSRLLLAGKMMNEDPFVHRVLENKDMNGQTSYLDNAGNTNLGAFQKIEISGLSIFTVIDEAVAFEAVANIQRRNIIIALIVINVSFVIVYLFSRTLSQPLELLVGATHKIQAGDFEVHIKPQSRDEIGSLTHSFTDMARGLKEREMIKDAFGKFVNKEIAAKVLRGEIKLGGEEKNCAVFFSDLRNFTAMSERLKPEEVVEFLNEYFSVMVDCVKRTGGVVDKFIGDAIMAHWGAVETTGADTENSINCALQMRQALIKFNSIPKTKSGVDKPPAQFGCGINAGPVISGQIGSEEKLEFTIIGDTVNLASRIEQLNKPFGTDVLVSEEAYEQVKHIFKAQKMPAITVKGKEKPQIIYAILGRIDDNDSPSSLTRVREMTGLHFDEKKFKEFDPNNQDEKKYEIIGNS